MKEIYNFLIEHSVLEKRHEDSIIEKRGIPSSFIKKFKFRSSGMKLFDLEESLRQFKDEDLVASGVFIKDKNDSSKPSTLNPVLLEDRILIPYLGLDGIPYHLRPHKLGFENVEIQIYQELNLADNPSEVVLAEGEFKACAGMVYGIPTIAVPGISSFSEQHFARLVKMLNDHRIRKVIILFDNEVKDDPRYLDKYKDNPNERHDTSLYAYYMAMKLEREGKETRIAILPDGWRTNGKIDFDGALAQGKTSGEIQKILYDSKTHKEFLKDIVQEARQVILRKLAQKRHRSNISKEWGHYIATRQRGGKSLVDEIISNFTIKILATHDTSEGIIREVIFINEQGKHSRAFQLCSDDMARSDNFASFCMNKGDFVWRGNRDDLLTLWESEFLMMDEGRHIFEPDHIGWIGQEKMWLFGNVAYVVTDKRELRADKNQTFWIEKRGIKPVALSVTTGKNIISEGIPFIHFGEIDEKEILLKLSETIGSNQAKQCLGWVCSVAYMEWIFERYSCFPFMFITGKRGCGKSTIAEWLMNFFGLENSGKMASETTPVALQRYMSYYSSLPVFIDEYRNTEQIRYKTGLLRNAYNRQSAGKGIKADFGIREAKIRGTLLLAGEETPEDNALLTRCIPVYISERERKKNHFSWFMSNRMRFSSFLYRVIKEKSRERFFSIFEEAKQHFTEQGVDERTAINFSIIVSGYATAFGDTDVDFAKWITSETHKIRAEQDEEQPVNVFIEYLIAMKTKGMVDARYWAVGMDGYGQKAVFLYFEGLFNEWSQEYRKTRGTVPFKKSAIRAYLKEEPGFKESNFKHLIKNSVKSCIVFDYGACSDLIKSLVDDKENAFTEDV